MRNLLRGIHDFQRDGFQSRRTLMERLAVDGQRPQIALVSCSDSRVLPEMFTQAAPGDIFLIRNAGNIVPAAGGDAPGEAASLEFAVEVLGVRDVVVCGHTHCGAVDAILHPEKIAGLETLEQWLLSSQETGRIVADRYAHLDDGDDLMRVAVGEHVLVQLEHLRTLPFIASRLNEPDFAIHGWVYDIKTGEVQVYDVETDAFRPLTV